jgi:hypothetical protein
MRAGDGGAMIEVTIALDEMRAGDGGAMIEVTIALDEILRWMDDPKRWQVPAQEWAAACGREKLRAAGIPLSFSFDPLKGPEVVTGRIEWFEDHLRKVKVFRWYP